MSRQSKKRRQREEAEREELLAPDAFVAKGATWSSWLEKNIKLIIGGLVLALLGIVGVEIFRQSQQSSAADATGDLIHGVEAYADSVSLQTVLTATTADGPREGWRDAREALRPALAEDRPAAARALARLYDADLARRLGELQQALAGYGAYLEQAEPSDPFRYFALEGQGYAHEAAGDLDLALAAFEKASQLERFTDYGLKHVARVKTKTGDTDGAKAAYEAIVARDPASPLKGFAEQQLALLD